MSGKELMKIRNDYVKVQVTRNPIVQHLFKYSVLLYEFSSGHLCKYVH